MANIPSSEITPPEVYFNRRTFIRGAVVAGAAVGTGLLYRKVNGVDIVRNDAAPLVGLVANPNTTGEDLTPELKVIN